MASHSRLVELLGACLVAFSCVSAGCNQETVKPTGPQFASAEEVELNFEGQSFVLGPNDSIALVRPPSWDKDRFLKLPFWLGANVLVPGVMQPKAGEYYVISEASLVSKLDQPNEWLIEAGSSLLKKDTIFVTGKTRYVSTGRILPTIVQYAGMRSLKKPGGGEAELPVLREVSLPMTWTLAGRVPKRYARFEIRGRSLR